MRQIRQCKCRAKMMYIDSRNMDGYIYRRYKCRKCGARSSTVEMPAVKRHHGKVLRVRQEDSVRRKAIRDISRVVIDVLTQLQAREGL